MWVHDWCLICRRDRKLQGGEDSQDPISCRSFSTKEPLNIGHFCGKWPIKIRDPMSHCHPVLLQVYANLWFVPILWWWDVLTICYGCAWLISDVCALFVGCGTASAWKYLICTQSVMTSFLDNMLCVYMCVHDEWLFCARHSHAVAVGVSNLWLIRILWLRDI